MALTMRQPIAAPPQAMVEAGRVLERYFTGELREANAVPELLHVYGEDSRSIIAAFEEKAQYIVANADVEPAAAARAGSQLVALASVIDRQALTANAAKSNETSAKNDNEVSKCLLEHLLQLSGGAGRASKEKACRSQTCSMIAALVASVPSHPRAEAKLLEYAEDKIPSIREKAVRGAAALERSENVQRMLVARSRDLHTAVRASAVRGLHACGRTAPALLGRLDDVEACVRAQVFHRLCEEPEAVEDFGPGALARLIAGVSDRSASVRMAAGLAVDAWCKRVGGIFALLNRCDVLGDEALGECAAAGLVRLRPAEGAAVASELLGQRRRVPAIDDDVTAASDVLAQRSNMPAISKQGLGMEPSTALLARCAIADMDDESRDEAVDVPTVLLKAQQVLETTAHLQKDRAMGDFLLRQLLHVLVITDICDEVSRREVEDLAEAVLRQAPLLPGTSSRANCRFAHSAIDFAIMLLRKNMGLVSTIPVKRRYKLEAECSSRVVILVGDLCQTAPTASSPAGLEEDAEDPNLFLTNLSSKIEELEESVAAQERLQESLDAQKKQAVADEDYVKAHEIKESMVRMDAQLQPLKEQHRRLVVDRDGICMRVLAIVTALLRWSNSDMRKDLALCGTFQSILRPIVMLQALSEDVQLAALEAIGLFCTLDSRQALDHWSFLTMFIRELPSKVVQNLPTGERRRDRARAALAAMTIADCARVHAGRGTFDREYVLSAASNLALVPFWARQVVIGPLSGWFLSHGHLYFEEHLKAPLPEVYWALGWMLAEAFTLQPEVSVEEGHDDEEAGEVVKQLYRFFTLLPQLPGRHGAPILLLAFESLVESGLWRRAVLLPKAVPGHTVWTRGFKWPSLFAFVHDHLPPELRFRIWRCSLQLCVSNPDLAIFAEIPHSLASAAADAPPGAPELLHEAIALGAHQDGLAPLLARLPTPPPREKVEALLQPHAVAVAAEREFRSELAKLGVDVASWAPGIEMQAPTIGCPALQRKQSAGMPKRSVRGRHKLVQSKSVTSIASAVQQDHDEALLEPTPRTPQTESPAVSMALQGDSGKKQTQRASVEARRRRAESEEQGDRQHNPAKRLKSKTATADQREVRQRVVKLPICNAAA